MKATLKEDVVNKYAAVRWIEVPLSAQERKEWVQEHRNAKAVPDTKRVLSPVFYAKAGDSLDVFPSYALNSFGPDKLDIFILVSKLGERFIVRREQITLEL